jgi:hypothetical protein
MKIIKTTLVAEFDLFTIVGIFIGGFMIFGAIVTILHKW